MVSHRTLRRRKTIPPAQSEWFLDSGGFTELSMFGAWQTTEAEYIAAARRYRDEIGNLTYASPQDWMCEPFVVAKTGLTVQEHQCKTIENYLHLINAAPDVPWVPVLQGWTIGDYLRCVEMYDAVGVDLAAQPLVGLGSVCRRQNTSEAAFIIARLHQAGLHNLHGYGFKLGGLRAAGSRLASSDSMAWSFAARRDAPLPGCAHKNCANCERYALLWREKVLAVLQQYTGVYQTVLEFAA
jgi:hypothetical protein